VEDGVDQYGRNVVRAGVLIVIVLLVVVVRRGKPKADLATGSLVFRYNALLKAIALVAAVGMPIVITAFLVEHPPKNTNDYIAIPCLYGLFIGLGGFMLWETLAFSLVAGPEGLIGNSPWRGRQVIGWNEIETVSYNRQMAWFVIHGTGDRKIRVSFFVSGLKALLEECEKHVPPERLLSARSGYALVGQPFPK
jgi:hypothetical protein